MQHPDNVITPEINVNNRNHGQGLSLWQEHKVCIAACGPQTTRYPIEHGLKHKSMVTVMAVIELEAYQTWLTSRITSSAFNTTVSPFAQRSQQYIKESLGQSDEKVRTTIYTLIWTNPPGDTTTRRVH